MSFFYHSLKEDSEDYDFEEDSEDYDFEEDSEEERGYFGYDDDDYQNPDSDYEE